MSGPYARQLTFKSSNLGRFTTIVLVFDKDVDGLFETKFPVVWRSSEFQSDGVSQLSVTFYSQPAYLKPGPLLNDVIVDIAASQALGDDQEINLLQDDIGRFSFTSPEGGGSGNATVKNSTSANQDVSLGFGQLDSSRPITPVYYWNPGDFKPSESIAAGINTVLRVYVSSAYDDAKVVRQKIELPALFDQDLSTLAASTTWILTYNHTTSQFEIKPELA